MKKKALLLGLTIVVLLVSILCPIKLGAVNNPAAKDTYYSISPELIDYDADKYNSIQTVYFRKHILPETNDDVVTLGKSYLKTYRSWDDWSEAQNNAWTGLNNLLTSFEDYGNVDYLMVLSLFEWEDLERRMGYTLYPYCNEIFWPDDFTVATITPLESSDSDIPAGNEKVKVVVHLSNLKKLYDASAAIEKNIASLVNKIVEPDDSKVEATAKIAEWIVKNIEYAYNPDDYFATATAYTALYDRLGCCAAQSELYQWMLDYCNIENYVLGAWDMGNPKCVHSLNIIFPGDGYGYCSNIAWLHDGEPIASQSLFMVRCAFSNKKSMVLICNDTLWVVEDVCQWQSYKTMSADKIYVSTNQYTEIFSTLPEGHDMTDRYLLLK